MPKINQEIESFARIMVVGIGGSGKNAINHMINSKVKGVSFICMNTDTQDLHHSLAEKKIHIGKNLTKGLGAGMNPEIGRKAAEETKAEIQDTIKGSDTFLVSLNTFNDFCSVLLIISILSKFSLFILLFLWCSC